MSPLRVALLRADDHQHRYLESLLRSRFDVRLVAVEADREKVRRARRRGDYRDYASHLYQRCRRAVTGRDRYRSRYFRHAPRLWALHSDSVLRVGSVNGEEVERALRETPVDVTVIIGCSLPEQSVLPAAGPLVVTVHGGDLPYYRGRHGFFFAVHDRRDDRVGSTVHRRDPGTGPGVLIDVVTAPPLTGHERPEQLYCRAGLLAVHRLMGWLEALERGAELPSPTGGVSRADR